MQLYPVYEITVNETSEQLIRDVERAARIVQELRPLPQSIIRRVEEELLGERVYSSNAIEGNTLDLRETVLILKSGVIGAKKKREATEAKNLGEAARTITRWVDAGQPFHTIDRLIEIHRIILTDIDDSIAGVLRNQQVFIAGAKHQPPDEHRVETLVKEVMQLLLESGETTGPRHGLLTATWAHWAITRVHPFFDGNGRMARLWQDFILYKSDLTCAIIRPEERRAYLSALSAADEGDFNPLVQLVAQRVAYALDRYIAEIKSDTEDQAFLKDLAIEADTRIEQKRDLSYMRWSRRMLLLRDAFELSAARLSEVAKQIQVQVRPYDLIDQTRWENILAGAGAERTWFFLTEIGAQRQGRSVRKRYFFFFGKHYWREGLDTNEDRSEQRVSLLISEDDGAGDAKRLDPISDCPVRLREVFLVGDEYVARMLETGSTCEKYERGLTPTQIAQHFLKDAILQRFI